MMYVEYIERDRFMPLEIFRHLANQGSEWADGQADRMVLQLGRSLRLGPPPTYLCFWQSGSFSRLDEWEEYFLSDEAMRNRRSQAMHRAMHIQRAGLYDELIKGEPGANRLFYLEFFEAEGGLPNESLASAFQERQTNAARLCFLLRRVGKLGPDPANLAVWGVDDYTALVNFARAEPNGSGVRLLTAGAYRNFGEEIL
jgi:hypothetical protein